MSEPIEEPDPNEPEPEATPLEDEPGPSDDEAAEQEQAEQDEADEAEQEQAEQEPAGPEPESAEDRKRQRDAERTVKNYALKITSLFSDQADFLAECPLCGGTQWPGFVHMGDAGQMPNEVKNGVMAFLGYATEREYPSVPDFRTCDACEGYGKVATGSSVPGKESVTCPRCQGHGYVQTATENSNGHAAPEGVVTGPTTIPSGAGVPDTDPSGEPRLLPDGRENPNYGKWPQYKVSVEPWGATAGLTVQDAPA